MTREEVDKWIDGRNQVSVAQFCLDNGYDPQLLDVSDEGVKYLLWSVIAMAELQLFSKAQAPLAVIDRVMTYMHSGVVIDNAFEYVDPKAI